MINNPFLINCTNPVDLDFAQQLIKNTQLPLGVICYKIGYTNHGHFSKLYKEKFGISPLNEREGF